ncbi:MAG: UDP-N-acetylmuramate dehydrogenase [Oligoflexia bacterium]|nr:UDP-N-acetylmuramate dehydrogenase [Oligoflexia bacterium]
MTGEAAENVAGEVAARWFRENAPRFSGVLLFEEPLARHTYYRIGGPAAVLATPKSREDLSWLAEGIRATGARSFILGAGSNVLASDEGFAGVVIRTGRMNLTLEASGELLRIGASVPISTLLRRAAQEGWGGLEFLTGIPGTVGGAVFMNAGTHLGETARRLRAVEAIDLADGRELTRFEGEALRFEYRRNLFLPRSALVWQTEWSLEQGDPAQVKATIDTTLARRKATQPIDFPSCGSVFKNPRAHGLNAWQVIEKLGLRGHRIGDAQFSEKHANFIINLGAARASDVKGLIELAKSRARAELGIELEEEVVFLGAGTSF